MGTSLRHGCHVHNPTSSQPQLCLCLDVILFQDKNSRIFFFINIIYTHKVILEETIISVQVKSKPLVFHPEISNFSIGGLDIPDNPELEVDGAHVFK